MAVGEPEIESWSARIGRAARRRTSGAVALLVKTAAPAAAFAGRLDVIASWLAHLPPAVVEQDPKLLYWSAASLLLERPTEAYPRHRQAFEALRDGADATWAILAWAGLLDAIFILYRDLRETDPLIEWMTPEREQHVDRMARPLHTLVVAAATMALAFRAPTHPRFAAWRLRAEKLVEADPTSDLGAKLLAVLLLDSTWRGQLGTAELLWQRFHERAKRVEPSPLMRALGCVNQATLRLHQGRVEACLEAVEAGIAESHRCGVRVWEGVLRCHGAAASLSQGDVAGARRHLAGIEQLFEAGIPADEAYYQGMLVWCEFIDGHAVGVAARVEASMVRTDEKGVPYFMAAARVAGALVLSEAGQHARAEALLEEARTIGRSIDNRIIAWIAGLFEAHMRYAAGETARGDAALAAALELGRAHGFVHFFFWPRPIVVRLVDRALALDLHPDYLDHLIEVHGFGPAGAPARSDRWKFAVRVYTFGAARVEHADGRVEALSSQSARQVELLAVLVDRGGRPVPLPAVAAEIYAGDDVDPGGSVKHVLHSLRRRIGADSVVQRDNALSLDFTRIWIDACSLQALRQAVTDPAKVERWLDRHYHGHFLERVEGSPVVDGLRRRTADGVQRTLAALHERCRAQGDDAACERLEARWRGLFPTLFERP